MPGERTAKLESMKTKSLGAATHVRGVIVPGVSLTRSRFKLKRVPEPESGVKPSFEKAEIRRVRIGPEPGKTLAVTFQFPPVSPALEAGGF